MSLAAAPSRTSAPSRGLFLRRHGAAFAIPGLLALGALAVAAGAAKVWATGDFVDGDDAMRALQVRDWLAGQSFFDLAQHRLDPAAPTQMHWSRLVDLPLAGALKAFSSFLPAAQAEAATRLAFPLAMLACLYGAGAYFARRLGGFPAQMATLALLFLGFPYAVQFQPGRIDHHSPQIALLLAAAGAMACAFAPARARLGAVCALACAASLAISLENLAFVGVLCLAPPILWIVQGERQAALLRWFSGALLTGLSLFYAAFVPRWTAGACDALSADYFPPLAAGAAALFALSFSRPAHVAGRIGAAALAAAAPLAAYGLLTRHCGVDPFVGIDPLARRWWLAHVAEVADIAAQFKTQPGKAAAYLGGVTAALAASLRMLAGAPNAARRAQWALLTALLAMGLVLGCLAERAFTSVLPLAALAGGLFMGRLALRVRKLGPMRILAIFGAGLPLAPAFWMAAFPAPAAATAGAAPTAPAVALAATDACYEPAPLATLNALKPGLILASTNVGPFLLAHTHHSALSGPYHRANHGNHIAIAAFLAAPDEAAPIVRGSGALWLLACENDGQMQLMTREAPASLAAALSHGHAPQWLAPVDLPGLKGATLYRIQ